MAVEETVSHAKAFAGESGRWDEFTLELLDLEKRLAAMDETGIELALLSLNAPGLQSIPGHRGKRTRLREKLITE